MGSWQRHMPSLWCQERCRRFVELFNFSMDLSPLWILCTEVQPSRIPAGRPQNQSCTQVSAWLPGSLFHLIILAFASCSSYSDQYQCPCRRTVSFPKHGTVTASRLCLEVQSLLCLMAQAMSCSRSPSPQLQLSPSGPPQSSSPCSSFPKFPVQLGATRTFVTLFPMLSQFITEYRFRCWEISVFTCIVFQNLFNL